MKRKRRVNGEMVRYLREEAWMTQAELGERIGKSEATIRRIEREKTPTPHRNTIMSLARALDVHPDELLHAQDDGPPLGAHSKVVEARTLRPFPAEFDRRFLRVS